MQLTGPHFAVMKVPKCNHKLHPSQDPSLRRVVVGGVGRVVTCYLGNTTVRERCLCVAGELMAESFVFFPSVVVECSGS